MSKKVIINASITEEIRIAIINNNSLVDLNFETTSRKKNKGNIYKGIVSNIENSLNAAFIEFGETKQAFLPLSEIRSSIYPETMQNKKKIKISDILKIGQEIIIQVVKDQINNKGAAVTTYLSLPGRYLVLMHSNENNSGISKKITNKIARQYARNILSLLNIPPGVAIIIRTTGTTCKFKELYKDFQLLCNTWNKINQSAKIGHAPTLLYKEPDIIIKTIRDYFSQDVKKIIIDDKEEFQEAHTFFKKHMPDMVNILEHHQLKEPIFQFYDIEKAINKLSDRLVNLPSGGYLIIEQTEAFVSIDVNSGKSNKEANHEITVFKTNMEAANEITKQLRLRDLSGIILIDFIDMISKKHKSKVEQILNQLMQTDKAKVKIGVIGKNGTLELTRQRIRQSHRLISHILCSHCNGTGRVRDNEGLAILALRKIHGYLAQKHNNLTDIIIQLPIAIANIINNKKRHDIMYLSKIHQLNIEILSNPYLINDAIQFKNIKRGQIGLAALNKYTNKSKLQFKNIIHSKQKNNLCTIGQAPNFTNTITINSKPYFLHQKINKYHNKDNDILHHLLFAPVIIKNIK